MLNGIHLADYGNHRDTRVTFGRMTALVGQNGAGKTSLLRAVMEVDKALSRQEGSSGASEQSKIRSGSSAWMAAASWAGSLETGAGDKQDGAWAFRTGSQVFRQWIWGAGLDFANDWVPDPRDNWEDIAQWRGGDIEFSEDNLSALTGPIFPGQIVQPLTGEARPTWLSRYFKTAASYLQGPSYSERLNPVLSEDCRDLAWMIAYLKGDEDEVFADIMRALRAVVPAFRQVRNRPVPVKRLEKKEIVISSQKRLYDEEQTVMGQQLRFDMASGSDLPASAISEGTLVTLAILTAIIHDDSPARNVRPGKAPGTRTILLDDIESGLHPSAQRDLVRQLRRLQETRPELQIIFSSHSPYIIDEMRPEEVWLFAPDQEGIAHCAKLSDHPDAGRALDVLTTGEFWSAEGESWVLDPGKRANAEVPATN